MAQATPYRLTAQALCAALLLLLANSCELRRVYFYSLPEPRPGALGVYVRRDVPYHRGPRRGHHRQRLDLYLPEGRTGFPMVLLVPGGAWRMGDNHAFGLYPAVASFLASEGIGVAVPSYRLSPSVRHPEHARDVARAFAWVRTYAKHLGADPDRLFLCGHSAGGHLVSLITTDRRYLAAEKVPAGAVKGVIAISGVYRVPEGSTGYALGGTSEESFHLGQLLPMRDESWFGPLFDWPGLPLRTDFYGIAFGDDPDERRDASPVCHVRPGLPPFLIVSAEDDLPTLPRMAEEFHQALCRHGCVSALVRVARRNHNSILFRATSADDEVGRCLLEFVRRWTPQGEE